LRQVFLTNCFSTKRLLFRCSNQFILEICIIINAFFQTYLCLTFKRFLHLFILLHSFPFSPWSIIIVCQQVLLSFFYFLSIYLNLVLLLFSLQFPPSSNSVSLFSTKKLSNGQLLWQLSRRDVSGISSEKETSFYFIQPSKHKTHQNAKLVFNCILRVNLITLATPKTTTLNLNSEIQTRSISWMKIWN
jgi:hypothetical protein